MGVVFIPFLGCRNTLLFGITVFNDLTFISIVTKIEFAGAEKLYTLLMKLFVSLIYEGTCFTTRWRWWSMNRKIFDVWHWVEFINGLPGLFYLWFFGVI